ncbi:MAG TPA: hypothetical protein VF323_01970 [Candidatus Limnocylindrales bacterium]
MDGLIRSIGFGLGELMGGAVGAVHTAIDAVVTQIERVLPGGSLPLVVVGVIVIVLGVNVLRH